MGLSLDPLTRMEQHMTYILQYPAIFGMVLGAIGGIFLAIRRQGKILDMLQYGASCGIIGGLLALIVNVVILRMG